MSALIEFKKPCHCGSNTDLSAIIGGELISDSTRDKPLIVITPSGAMHLHDVIVTTASQMTIRAAASRAWSRLAVVRAFRAWIARNIIDDDPYPFERTGLDLLELNGAPR